MSKAKAEVIRPFTDADIENHAGKVGGRRNLREISIDTDGGDYQFHYLVKKPSRGVLEAIASEEAKKNGVNVSTIQKLMLGCVLEGDAEAYEYDGGLYSELLRQIGNLIKETKGDIKKI